MEFTTILLPLFAFWLLALCLFWSRPDLSLVWKVAVGLIFFFYTIVFSNELLKTWNLYTQNFLKNFPKIFEDIISVLPVLLLLFWPFVLIVAYNNTSTRRTENLVRLLVLVTLFYWVYWMGAKYFDLSKDKIVKNPIVKIITGFHLPPPPL